MKQSLTPKQKRILTIVEVCTAGYGRPPMLKEVAKASGQSRGQIQQMLLKIDGKGWISYTSSRITLRRTEISQT